MKRISVLLTMLVLCLAITAQNNPQQQGNWGARRGGFSPEMFFKKMKDFVVEKASLTQSEANSAYPIMKEMLGKQHGIQAKQMDLRRRMMGQISEEEYGKAVEQFLCNEVKIKQIEEAYYKKLRKVMPWSKVLKVRDAINEYHMNALYAFQNSRHHRGFHPAQEHK